MRIRQIKASLIFLLIAGVLLSHAITYAQNARWKEVKIYLILHNAEDRADNPGNLYPVRRRVSARNPLRATLVALTNGPTAAEAQRKYFNPTFGIKLLSAKIKNGVAYTYFTMPEGAMFSGDLSPLIFRDAVIRTASQFPGVRKVIVCLDGDLDFWSEADTPPKKCPRV